MCASYGLGGGDPDAPLPDDFPPLDERDNQLLLREWMHAEKGKAKLTGDRAKNLNPVILGHSGRERELVFGWWWIWQNGHGKARFDAFNSKVERLTESRAWKPLFQHRALLPATDYIEKGSAFGLPDGEVFGIAAITNTVTLDDGTELLSYSMLTREAVGVAAETWHRMPVILPRDAHDRWLDPDQPGDDELAAWTQTVSHGTSASVVQIRRDPILPENPAAPTLF